KQKGFSVRVCPEAILFHKRSASFVGGRPHTSYFWWRNRLLWIEKNCPSNERRRLKRSIMKEYLYIFKAFLLKLFQYPFVKKTYHRRLRLRSYLSIMTGIHHYFFRRFGNCPSWIFKKI
ncbi:MAG: hypothetical protein KDK76_05730, partial [Chlamydiia bacterium]|nr:hypothetical protein [Chlamydiia bacterium]